MRPDIGELIERLEKATGPDRYLDLDIAIATGQISSDVAKYGPYLRLLEARRVDPYTASLDAVIALVEQKLPGCSWQLHWRGIGKNCDGWIERIDPADNDAVTHRYEWGGVARPTPAVALCLALLRSLQGEKT